VPLLLKPLIHIEATFQGAVGNALLTLKQFNDLGHKLIVVHGGFSARLGFSSLILAYDDANSSGRKAQYALSGNLLAVTRFVLVIPTSWRITAQKKTLMPIQHVLVPLDFSPHAE
jgi:hypothetical protein